MIGRQPLLLLPGLDGTEVLFGPLLQALPDWIEPHVVSYPTSGRNGYDDLLPLVVDAVRRLPHCHVLGWSFSGPLALRAARAEPERVRSIVLASSFLRAPKSWLRGTGPLLSTPVIGTIRALRRLPIWLLRAPSDPLRRDKAKLWQRVPARTLAARTRAIRGVDERDTLRACVQPVLYLAAANDRVVPLANRDEVLATRPGTRSCTIPGRHLALYTHAAEAAAAIGEFVRLTASAAPAR